MNYKPPIILLLLLALSVHQLHAQTRHKTKTHSKSHAVSATAIANGSNVYYQYCLSCHQVDGGGVPDMNPPLIKTSYVMGSKMRLIKVVLNGFMQPVEIDGESYSNNMPSHNYLTDQQIADVLTYIRNSFTNKSSAVYIAEVRAVRAANKNKK